MVDLASGDGDNFTYSDVKRDWDEDDFFYSESSDGDQGAAGMAFFSDCPFLFDDLGIFLL